MLAACSEAAGAIPVQLFKSSQYFNLSIIKPSSIVNVLYFSDQTNSKILGVANDEHFRALEKIESKSADPAQHAAAKHQQQHDADVDALHLRRIGVAKTHGAG